MLFHLICLSGLIWQLTQILVNYFIFDVVSDIKMPRKYDTKSISICLRNYQLINYDVFLHLLANHPVMKSRSDQFNHDILEWSLIVEKLTMGERFKLAIGHERLFIYSGVGKYQISYFVINFYLCYRF